MDSTERNKEAADRMMLNNYRSQAIKAARDLGYGKAVVEQIKVAETVGRIERIMKTARHEKFG